MDTCEFLLMTEDSEFGNCGKDAPWGTYCAEHANLACEDGRGSCLANHICTDNLPHCADHCRYGGAMPDHPDEQSAPPSDTAVLS